MSRTDRWLVRAASVLAVSLMCSCSTTYVPDQSSVEKMSAQEARNIVLEQAQAPVHFFDVHANDASSWNEEISKVYLRTATITVIVKTGKRAVVALKNIDPLVFRNQDAIGWYVDIFLLHGPNDGVMKVGVGFVAWQAINIPLFSDPQVANRLADALLVLKSAAIKFAEDDEARFQDAARGYQAAAPKPQLPEAARRFAVQAEDAINDKDFDAATDYYEQALKVAPWWPEGHYNRAIVLSETDDYPDAIMEMKRYLVLVPGAPNARAMQDKIYKWERKASPAS